MQGIFLKDLFLILIDRLSMMNQLSNLVIRLRVDFPPPQGTCHGPSPAPHTSQDSKANAQHLAFSQTLFGRRPEEWPNLLDSSTGGSKISRSFIDSYPLEA